MTTAAEILSRYQEAAKALATSPALPQRPDHLTARGAAAQQLLRRQASSISRLHDAWARGAAAEDAGVDQELLRTRLDDLAEICMSAFYSYRFDRLPCFWRQIYSDTLILKSHFVILQDPHSAPLSVRDGRTLDLIVEDLDRALITAGGAGDVLGKAWIEGTLGQLERLWRGGNELDDTAEIAYLDAASTFSTEETYGRPTLSEGHECPRHQGWGLGKFEAYMMSEEEEEEEGHGGPRPVVLTDLIDEWPALTDHPWKSPEYLLSRTIGGKRLVPIELGRSYVDDGWSQELMPFGQFLHRYITEDKKKKDHHPGIRVGYLAQHNLFQQVPSLRNDVLIPDLCWASVPAHPTDPSKNQPALETPQLNAWFGPARTITPLHTDGYHNLLCQVVGTKYVRLYPPSATHHLRPRDTEHGVDMRNTSELDIGVMEGWDPAPGRDTQEGEAARMHLARESLTGVEFWECILTPGDTLVIPIGWWHYVRSLSTSFSVSFWWN